jgi:hypothetical protein
MSSSGCLLSKSPNLNPLGRQPSSAVLSLSLSDSSFSDTSTLGPKNGKFKYSTDSLSSFEDYRIENDTPPESANTYIYVRCALPTSRATCTGDFIKTMCCNCGRG